nr:MAG TPA: hypothetical protein [Caudoviricetes sp.]
MTICRAGDRLKTVPRSADTTWILIFCRDRVGQKRDKVGHFRDKNGTKGSSGGPHYPLG